MGLAQKLLMCTQVSSSPPVSGDLWAWGNVTSSATSLVNFTIPTGVSTDSKLYAWGNVAAPAISLVNFTIPSEVSL